MRSPAVRPGVSYAATGQLRAQASEEQISFHRTTTHPDLELAREFEVVLPSACGRAPQRV
jgi:hypothetical protein